MATGLTYTTGSRSAELDGAFEAALAEARQRDAEPLPHLVGGKDVSAGDVFAREDPSRREHVASRAHEGAAVVGETLAAARAAARDWRRLPYTERLVLLRSAESLIEDRKLELASAISMEVGKVRTESVAEVEEAIDLIETYCRQVESAEGFETPLGRLSPDERNLDVLRPYGVFGVIAPFNFPFALGFGMTAAALAAGNAVILKPPEEAPLSGGAVARLLVEAGVPEGVVSLLHGGPRTGEALAGAGVDGVAFTGSAEVGREIGRRLSSGPFPRPVLAEMGGKNPASFLDEIEAGVVYVNRRAGATTGTWPGIQSFCGWKASGLTGKGGLGPYYVQQFAREQSRTIVEL